jgi:hypothetical protein
MELCILKFAGARVAENVLEAILVTARDWLPWLHDISVVSRTSLGRLTIRAPGVEDEADRFEYEEGELVEMAYESDSYTRFLVGPARASSWSSELDCRRAAAGLALDVERSFFHTGALRDLLGRDSSALLLVADDDTCVAMVDLFAPYHPNVSCRPVSEDADDCLASLDPEDELVGYATKASMLH